MLSRRECGELLARANSLSSLAAITRAIGFLGTPDPLDGATRRELGIADDCRRAWVQQTPGGGALRALLLDFPAQRTARDCLTRIASRLGARGGPLLWLICGAQRHAQHVAIGAIDVSGKRPRVRALVAEQGRVTDSDAETLAALAGSLVRDDDLGTYLRWLEVLGREAVTRRFFSAVAHNVERFSHAGIGTARADHRHAMALVTVTRLLFLAFLEAKGWLDGNRSYLADRYAACMRSGGSFHRRVLWPLFFGTLNTRPSARAPAARALGAVPFLNGGLFARSVVEKVSRWEISDSAMGDFLDEVLTRYRFTSREESTEWSEAAIDPEMLGKAFESLMAPPTRRGSGSFFTPHALVAHVSDVAIQHALEPACDREAVAALLHGDQLADAALRSRLMAQVARLRILDPACGSGAFLVHVLERLAALRSTLGDARAPDALRRTVLVSSIYGVDVNPMAVWLCELRLWLACVIESDAADAASVAPLPNLDRNIKVGDALTGDIGETRAASRGDSALLTRLRGRYARASGARKATYARALDRETRRYVLAKLEDELARLHTRRRDLIHATRGRDLFGGRRGALSAEREQLRDDRRRARDLRRKLRELRAAAALPFSFDAHFADVLDDGGFDVVLGNPPWVRPHRISSDARRDLRQRYGTLRDASWPRGAELSGARSGFGGQADLAAAFVERSLSLVRDHGVVALLVPAKLWKSLAGGGLRRRLLAETTLCAVEDWSDGRVHFEAAVYPSLIVTRRGSQPAAAPAIVVHCRDLAIRWCADAGSLSFDDSAGSPWLLLPPDARRAFDRLLTSGVALHEAGLGRITLGVKTGFNDAFIVGCDSSVESSMLRPLLRGEDVAPWRCTASTTRIIWTHDRSGAPLQRLPPEALRHLRQYRHALEQRTDARRSLWWSLFRTEAARSDRPRVVWADLARTPRAAVLDARDPTVPLNSCYVLPCKDATDANTLCALLNSPVASAWLGAIAEPARGGYRRLLAWTVALFPVPEDWALARDLLGALGAAGAAGSPPAGSELFEAACRAYRVRPASLAALCEWSR